MIPASEKAAVQQMLALVTKNSPTATTAGELLANYHATTNEILGSGATSQGKEILIAEAHTKLHAAMCNLVDPLIPMTASVQRTTPTTSSANHSAEEYRAALFQIVQAWRAVRPLGFVRGGMGDPAELLRAVAVAAALTDPPAVT